MATEIIMPKNGMDMTEGMIVRWLKNVGDMLEKDEPIMEIETDKITMEAEAPAAGILVRKCFEDGAVVPVLTVVGYIGKAGENVPLAPQAEKEGVFAQTTQPGAPEKRARKAEYDVAVIGGGPAGYVAAIKAAQLGGKVILFEKDTLGGTCLNRGCIPTKAYIKTAEYLHNIRRATERGIVLKGDASVDMPSVVRHKNKVVKTLTTGVAGLLKSNGVNVIKGEAALKSATEVVCGEACYTADKVILCGGSEAGILPIPGVDHPAVLTSDGILSLEGVPERLCVIGGGVIGCEIAQAFTAFGSKVTVVEALDRLVANMDADISAKVNKALIESGAEVLLGVKVNAVEDEGGKPAVLVGDRRIACDNVLLSIGRFASLGCLGALKGDIKTERGKVVVNDKMETSVKGVYAAGDINGRLMLAHAAFKMAECAAANAMDQDVSCDLSCTPSGLYGIPEAACVGLTEVAAREKYGDAVAVGSFPMAANGRALASGERDGFVKVIIEKRFGQILGVHIVAADAVEMIALPAALMAMEVTANEVADDIIHGHPTFSEAFMEACADALGRSIHLPARK